MIGRLSARFGNKIADVEGVFCLILFYALAYPLYNFPVKKLAMDS